jgi:opacity protein-like surface antigen
MKIFSNIPVMNLVTALIVLSAGILAMTCSAAAQTHGYAGGALGAVLARDSSVSDTGGTEAVMSYDTGFVFSLAAGARFDWGGRLEGEMAWRRLPGVRLYPYSGSPGATSYYADTTLWGVNGMVNYWQELFPRAAVTPYVGGGMGVAWVTVSDAAFNATSGNDSTGFAWQAGGGLLFKVGSQFALDLGYRYFGIAGLEFGQQQRFGTSLGSHTLTLGIMSSFR